MHSIIEPQSLAVVICGIHRIFERFSVELASQDSLAGFIEVHVYVQCFSLF